MDERGAALRWLTAAVAVLAAAYALLLVPGVRGEAGYRPWIDGWLNGAVDAAVVAALAARACRARSDRAAWLLLAAGLAAALGGSIGYYAHYQHLDELPSWTWSDVGWLAFYPVLYAGLVVLLRERVRRVLRSTWLDGVGAGLTAAAVAVAYLGVDVGPAAGAGLARAYPVGDLLLLSLSVAAVVLLGRGADATWLLLCASFVVFAGTDAIYADQAADGTYVAGGWLDLGWLLARLLLVGAAWTSLGAGPARAVDPRGWRVLLVPGACTLLVLAILFDGTRGGLPDWAAVLALAAGATVVVRTAATFLELRELGEARRLARTDDLTGIANRRHLQQAVHRLLLHERRPCALALLDLDQFKQVNDGLGHEAGDELLRLVAGRLAAVAPDGALVARMGGDEFALLLPDATAGEAKDLARTALAELRRPFALGAATLSIDGSVGVVASPAHADEPGALLRMADLAMYASKRRRLGVAVYEPARDAEGLDRLHRITALADGIRSGQIELRYQPKVDLVTGGVPGVEALVRWRHPTEGLLAPHAFLPLAESSGLMGELTAEVLRLALRDQRRWAAQGTALHVAVNISPSALLRPGCAQEVRRLLEDHGVAGAELTLEVTEDVLVDDRARALGAALELRAFGVRISIDDYGTGYSSLAYLKDLPVDELKLDRHFVADVTTSAASGAIVRSTIALAEDLGLDLVVEGVEDEAALAVLRAAGCPAAQGFVFGQPISADELLAELGARR